MQEPRPTEGTGNAVASLIFGILGLVFCPIVCSVLALVFGYKSRNLREPAEGMATAGIILGWVGLAFGILGVIVWILIFALGVLSGLGH